MLIDYFISRAALSASAFIDATDAIAADIRHAAYLF